MSEEKPKTNMPEPAAQVQPLVRRLARNKHTGRTAWILSIETVSNPPITVYVLDDLGKQERWKSDEFFANWLTA